MARSRIIKHEFWTSEDILELDITARLFFIGFWNFADDSGILPDKPKKLKCMIFPADNIDCAVLVDMLVTCGVLVRYMCGTESYLRVKNWSKHQTIKFPTFRYPIEDGTIPQSAQRKKEPKKETDIETDIGIGVEEHIPVHVPDMYGTCATHTTYTPDFQQYIFSTLGGPYTSNVTEWLTGHEEDKIRLAIAKAESVNKLSVSYVGAILANWARDGYPKEDTRGSGKAEHKDNSRDESIYDGYVTGAKLF